MATRNLKMQSVDGSSIVFSDPLNIKNQLRFKNVVANKTVSGVTATNVRSETTYNEEAVMTQGDQSAIDALSIKVVISGSTQNTALLQTAWTNMKANMDTAIAADLLKGFRPEFDATFVTGA